MTDQMQIVSFDGDALETVRDERGVWVSTRRVCDALGIDFASQTVKLRAKPWACVGMITTHDATGRQQEMHALHLDSVPMWLATIDENRVADHVRPKLQRYQVECARVLRDHFFGTPAPVAAITQSARDEVALVREHRLMARERRLAAKMVADVVDRMETLAPRARDALRAKAIEPAIGDVTMMLPAVGERFLTITEVAQRFGVTPNTAGRARKAAGVEGNRPGICEVRLGKSQHADRNVEQTLVTPTGAAMIGQRLVDDLRISRADYETACAALGVDPLDTAAPDDRSVAIRSKGGDA